MDKIENFIEIRRDGRIIDEQMTLDEMIRLKWEPAKVTALRWEFKGLPIELTYPNGVLATLLPDRQAVAAISDGGRRLTVLYPDGTEMSGVSNIQMIRGQRTRGLFRWFESARSGLLSNFDVVFETTPDGRLFEIEICSLNGEALEARPTR